MKKRVFASLLAFALALTLLPMPALALGTFSDVTDAATARNVEVLRLMGVISGDESGRFRPAGKLTRAEFCKMAIELQGRGDEVVRYRSRTVFPDVRVSHWAAGYINLASTVEGENKTSLMHGTPDGHFFPDRTISYGEAVAVLMRMLGYDDKDSGGIWPQGYLDLAAAKGLTKGLTLAGNAEITRSQAAQLFVNALAAKTKADGTLKTLGDETVLLSIDLAKGVMRTADSKNPEMANPMMSTQLNGLRGRVVYNEKEKALTFLPSSGTGGGSGAIAGATSDAAIIVDQNGSTAGFDTLAGGSTRYAIYRNGNRVNAKAIKKYDVATYSAASDAILLCDTRISVYYEDFMPSRTAPVTITALGGTELSVLPTAQQSVAKFQPGDMMTLLLTADGQIAGAVESGTNGAAGNATGYVDSKGAVTMFCGGGTMALKATSDKTGQVVDISANKEGVHTRARFNDLHGAVDVTNGTLGGRKLAENVLVLQDGVLTSLSALGVTSIAANRIVYARLNDNNQVDLIVMGIPESDILYGRAIVHTTSLGDGEETYTISVDCGAGGTKGPYGYVNPDIYTGDFICVKKGVTEDFVRVTKLERVAGVTKSSWVGTELVNANGKTYEVLPNVPCWNSNTKSWFTSVEKAIEYDGAMELYLDSEGVVRVISVKG